jgi:hypothetical protein
MFQSAISPIRDAKGDDTVNVVCTPYFSDSPLPAAAAAKTKLCLRLFEDSVKYSSEWTTDSCPDGCRCQVCHYADLYGYDSSSNDWTTDSEPDTEDTEIPFQWCATP